MKKNVVNRNPDADLSDSDDDREYSSNQFKKYWVLFEFFVWELSSEILYFTNFFRNNIFLKIEDDILFNMSFSVNMLNSISIHGNLEHILVI